MRVVVVGAGMSGLVAARSLHEAGAGVVVVDKGATPGGRLATLRIGSAVHDEGAQFFTVRTPAFQRRVDDWVHRGIVAVWNHGFAEPDGHPRYVAPGGMDTLATDLADGLDVECSTMAFTIRPRIGGDGAAPWQLVIDDGSVRDADAVVLTTPLPQAFALLADSGVMPDDHLLRTDYDRTIALLAVLDGPPNVPEPGAIQNPNRTLSFVADNVRKGISTTPAITIHASAHWSRLHWDDPPHAHLAALTESAAEWLGDARVVEHRIKRWRFATPHDVSPDPCWVSASGSIVLAGDAFAGPRVEGAHNSGLAAAHALTG